ncbi:unnamed protein product [Rhodiola kirilowii]
MRLRLHTGTSTNRKRDYESRISHNRSAVAQQSTGRSVTVAQRLNRSLSPGRPNPKRSLSHGRSIGSLSLGLVSLSAQGRGTGEAKQTTKE